MEKPDKLLLIFLDETDLYEDIPLYEAVVRWLLQQGISGATVIRGIMGYGKAHLLHQRGLFGITDDRPIALCVVDQEQRLRPILPHIRTMVADCPILLMDAEWIP